MGGNACPRLVWILIQLARNWAISRDRLERYEKRQRRADVSAEADDAEGEALWAAYHDHPFPGFVRWVSHRNGEDQDAILAAALKEFNGEPALVAKLNELDDKGVTAELFAKLRGECPDIVKRLFASQSEATATTDAGTSALTDLLDEACEVFMLANKLGGDLKEDFNSQGPVIMAGEPTPRQRHGELIREFTAAVLKLSDGVKNPPTGFAAVAEQLRKAGQIAKLLRDTNTGDILGLFPDLKTVAEYGYQAVKSARNATQQDDPFAVFVDATQSKPSDAIKETTTAASVEEVALSNGTPQSPSVPPKQSEPPKKPKRSTERGEGRLKLIAALTKWHKYADGGCLNFEAIGNNELARQADVAKRTASAFFDKEFQGHAKYKVLCNDSTRLVAALKALNGEFRPHDFYDARGPEDLEEEDE